MWRQILSPMTPWKCSGNSLLTLTNNVIQQFRTTFIMKRRWPPGLRKKGLDYRIRKMRARHFVYDLVEDTNVKKREELEVILTDYVAGIGNRGDLVKMKQSAAYHKLLLPGLAVYASPENIEKYSRLQHSSIEKPKYSSPFVPKTIEDLSSAKVVVLMNKDIPWTIEPWHIRMSFRKAGFHVPEDAIALPEKPIIGPNMDLENKYFEVVVTINNTEIVPVKCVVHHWSTNVSDRLPPVEKIEELPLIPIFPEKVADSNPNESVTVQK